jgi:hypothetical protein
MDSSDGRRGVGTRNAHAPPGTTPVTLYDDHVVVDTTVETEFAHQMLVAWAAWVYGGGKLNVRSCSRVLDMATSELAGHKSFSEDQLLLVDRAIAQLPLKMQRVINIHYRSSEDEPMTRRYLRVGLSRLQYRTLLVQVQGSLYARLMPEVDEWRHSVL